MSTPKPAAKKASKPAAKKASKKNSGQNPVNFQEAVVQVKTDYEDPTRKQIENDVIARFQNTFSAQNIDQITEQNFYDFKQNTHWKGIERHKYDITRDMGKLKGALKVLIDENQPIIDRFNDICNKDGTHEISFLKKAKLTPILLVAYPRSEEHT